MESLDGAFWVFRIILSRIKMIFKQIIINRLSFLILCLALLTGIYCLSLYPTLKCSYFMAIAVLFVCIIYRLSLLKTKPILIYLLITALIVPLILTLFDLDIVRTVLWGHYTPLNNQVLIYTLAGLVTLAEVYIFCITCYALFKKISNPTTLTSTSSDI